MLATVRAQACCASHGQRWASGEATERARPRPASLCFEVRAACNTAAIGMTAVALRRQGRTQGQDRCAVDADGAVLSAMAGRYQSAAWAPP